MFFRGAESARDFLLNFDWAKYQQEITSMKVVLNEKSVPEVSVQTT